MFWYFGTYPEGHSIAPSAASSAYDLMPGLSVHFSQTGPEVKKYFA